MADLHVLVHHLLPCLLRFEVPVRALGERIDDQVACPLAIERRLLLAGRLADVLGGTDPTDQGVRDTQPTADPVAHQRRGRFLEGVDRWREAPEQQVDARLKSDRRVGVGPDGPSCLASEPGREVAGVVTPSGSVEPPPRRIEPECQGLHVGASGVRHARSSSHRARSAAAYVITIPAPARTMAPTDSRSAARRSSQPRWLAASIIAYSPLTW